MIMRNNAFIFTKYNRKRVNKWKKNTVKLTLKVKDKL